MPRPPDSIEANVPVTARVQRVNINDPTTGV